MSEQTFEEYVKQLEDEGYINEKGAPLKCIHCYSKDLDEKAWYENYYIVERVVYCKNCGRDTGHWSYGNWYI